MVARTPETSVYDVVEYIRKQLPDSTSMVQHKLAYYAQGWHAAWEGVPLFAERIEAWKHGPVVRDLWVAEKSGGRSPIAKALSESARRVVDAVLGFYGHLTAAQLRALTHMEAPWISARGGLPEGAHGNREIPVGSMRRYFVRKSVLDEPAPARPAGDAPAPMAETMELANQAILRWREALDKLA